MKDYEVNFNNKTILLEGEWLNIKELGEKIKYNINKGNYKIKNLFFALERLQEVLESAIEVNISLKRETHDKLELMSKKYNKSVQALIREAILESINSKKNDKLEDTDPFVNKELTFDKETKKIKPEIISEDVTDKLPPKKPNIIEPQSKPTNDVKQQPSIIVEETYPKEEPSVVIDESQLNIKEPEPSVIIDESLKKENNEDNWFKI